MASSSIKPLRCAIYTRKSTEHGLEQEFNSLDAQRDACEAYIKSQASQGWKALPQHYDDPAYSGGNLDRPALQQLLKDIDAGRIDVIVVYKIDRLTRSLADFAKLTYVEFEVLLKRLHELNTYPTNRHVGDVAHAIHGEEIVGRWR
jgi:resolvase-like protein